MTVDLINRVGGHCADGVVVGGTGGCWSYFGVSVHRDLSAWGWQGLGLTGTFTTWEVTPIDVDSNIKYYAVCFSFLGNCVQS